ncbi:MAG: Asp-tRNA(Asn)/Glu-tRNA(Gln) amidotransferase subunit GatC [Nitrospirota bacterium]
MIEGEDMEVITRKEVEHIAKLARLGLSDKERHTFCIQLSRILEYVNKLNELDTSKVEADSHLLPLKNLFREDMAGVSLDREEALKNAPEKKNEFFSVPKIIEG